jgi:alanyl-tRNA synthetase
MLKATCHMVESNWQSQQIREEFLRFFEGKKHKRLPSFPLIPPAGDTTLWISAGMQPFKAEFAGIAKPVSPRITTCQKCVRADDIERVGHTTRHHTFFEMLGNFSFGDYFKEEAIAWAWELLTQIFKMPVEKLFVSVHPQDEQAYQIWNEKIGLPKEKIFKLSDNWWGPIGATGTCGPDSEIYYDRGPKFSCGKPDCAPGCENKRADGSDCDRYIELWNLVFTMYHKDEQGKLHELPQKNIDTGAGLERLAMVLQEKESPFETDLFEPVMKYLGEAKDAQKIIAQRIVADHMRAVVFMMAEGVLPSNEGRGYVVQRLLRRAAIYLGKLHPRYYEQWAVRDPGLFWFVKPIVEIMKNVYPELKKHEDDIITSITNAENEFLSRIRVGKVFFEALMDEALQRKTHVISGEMLFKLHDEKGIPFEMSKEFFLSAGFQVDEAGFKKEMEKQRERSRAKQTASDVMAQALKTQTQALPAAQFLGYETLHTESQVVALFKNEERVDGLHENEEGIVVLDATPFYAESGGQVGDTGTLVWSGGTAAVLDTQKNDGGVFFHKVRIAKGELKVSQNVQAIVDAKRREQIRKHHTATHMLHAALREVLGTHVQQAGSYVCDSYLRLDFSHPQSLTEEELRKIEACVNEKALENIPLETKITSQEEAQKLGALAFFGEKYGQEVRVVLVDDWSKELCGGTHVNETGEIGPFVILKESSIAKGIRRIEAKAGKAAVAYIQELQRLKSGLTERLKVDLPDMLPQLDQLLREKQEHEKEIRRLKRELASFKALSLLEKQRFIQNISLIAEKVDVDEKEALRAMVDALKERVKSGVILLAAPLQEKISLVCGITSDLVKGNFSAVELLKPISKIIGGGGGGKADLAEAGGKNPEKLPVAFAEFKKNLEEKINSVVRS